MSFDVQLKPFSLISFRNTWPGKLTQKPKAYCDGVNGDPSTDVLFIVAVISGSRNAQLLFVFLTGEPGL